MCSVRRTENPLSPNAQKAENGQRKTMKTVAEILYDFNARMGGDNTVDVYALFRDISAGINRPGGRALLGKPLQWSAVMLDRWHKEFRKGVSHSATSLYDTLQRVSILMESDLWAFESRNESAFKETLFENHRQYLELIHNATPMHNAQCIMHNVTSIHNAQCIMHNEFQNDRSDYELCIMNYELTKALQSFLLSSAPYLTFEEYTTYDTQIRALSAQCQ